jgi:hypothetical protein
MSEEEEGDCRAGFSRSERGWVGGARRPMWGLIAHPCQIGRHDRSGCAGIPLSSCDDPFA